MSTLEQVETAARTLPLEQKRALFRHLAEQLGLDLEVPQGARLVRRGGDALLEAAPGALPMTPENIRKMLADWP